MSAPELSVVCKNCGSEASPYVTECPYCGHRLRKRAPKLERRGETLEAKEPRRVARRSKSKPKPKFGRSRIEALDTVRPVASLGVIAASAFMLLAFHALPLRDLGQIFGPVAPDYWRYVTAPFANYDLGYLFVVGLAIAIFGPGVERRLGSIATLLLMISCGALGMLIGDEVATLFGDTMFAAGGNGLALGVVACWLALRERESRSIVGEDYDRIGVFVVIVALLALPIFDLTADGFAGIGGGLMGGLAGLLAGRLRPVD